MPKEQVIEDEEMDEEVDLFIVEIGRKMARYRHQRDVARAERDVLKAKLRDIEARGSDRKK